MRTRWFLAGCAVTVLVLAMAAIAQDALEEIEPGDLDLEG